MVFNQTLEYLHGMLNLSQRPDPAKFAVETWTVACKCCFFMSR